MAEISQGRGARLYNAQEDAMREAWEKYRKTRNGYLHDHLSFEAGYRAGEDAMRERAASKAYAMADYAIAWSIRSLSSETAEAKEESNEISKENRSDAS